jgi:hypothetical protein
MKTTITRPALRDVSSLPKTYSAADLMKTVFKPRDFIVEDVLVNGLTILAGKPKKGKSWMTLAMLMDIARGVETFGVLKTKKSNAIYYDLEGGPQRLKERLSKLLQDGSEPPQGLHITHELSRDEWEKEIERAVRKHDAKVVAIDTLTKIRPSAPQGNDSYQQDYDLMSRLHALAHRLHIVILVVYHTRKAASDDAQDQIIGSTGTVAAVDSWFVFKSDKNGLELQGAGRDIEPVEWALEQEGSRLVIAGDAKERRVSGHRREILRLLRERGEMTNDEIAKSVGREKGAVNQLLMNMHKRGEIERLGHGRYEVPAK